jgi:hypothetical protein
MAEVLAEHQVEGRGMTYGSPDSCTCGAKTYAERGDEEISIRRAQAFAAHQAAVLAANGYGKLEDASRELKFLHGERKTLGKELDHFESQGHSTVTIKYLRRFIGRRPK